MQANMDARCHATPEAETQRDALRKAIAFKSYEFDTHGVEMNQRYVSRATVGGEAWQRAAAEVAERLGIEITVHLIGPRRPWQDHSGDWARLREIADAGCLLVRPDHHVAWRSQTLQPDCDGALADAFRTILALEVEA